MNRDTMKIKAGLQELAHRPYEIVSGVVTAVDASFATVSVRPTGVADTIEGVMLRAIGNADNGLILMPEPGSDVVIGSIDGPGMWTVLKTSKLQKAVVTVGPNSITVDGEGVKILCGNTEVEIGSLLKLNTAAESLHGLLQDIVNEIALITVTTAGAVSAVPNNAAMFATLAGRVSALLTS